MPNRPCRSCGAPDAGTWGICKLCTLQLDQAMRAAGPAPELRMGFPRMIDVLPETPIPDGPGLYIQHVTVSEEDAHQARYRAALIDDAPQKGDYAGTFCTLKELHADASATMWMSDTYSERWGCKDILGKAYGRVLVIGLGIGMLQYALALKQGVTEVHTIELSKGVLDLVMKPLEVAIHERAMHTGRAPALRRYSIGDGNNFPSIDKSDFYFQFGHEYDTIWLDYWANLGMGDIPMLQEAVERWRPALADGGIIDAWLLEYLTAKANRVGAVHA